MPRSKPPQMSFRAAAMIAEGKRGQSRVADSLKESEHLFRTLTEKSVAGIYVVQDGQFRFVNANAASYAGYSAEELIGKKSDFMVHPEDREAVKENARAMLRGERSSPHEFRIVTKRGETCWIFETVASITLDGKPAILGNSMDISEEKRAQEKLRESAPQESTVQVANSELGLALRPENRRQVQGCLPAGDLAYPAFWEGGGLTAEP